MHCVQVGTYRRPVTSTRAGSLAATDGDAPPPGRRELNKARTRERLLKALRDQLRAGRTEGLTVEAVAEAAGVSRRTFFNYFPTLEAALAEGMSSPITALTEAFVARPADEPPLVAMQRTVEASPVPHELLAWIAAVKCSGQDRHGLGLNVWSYHRDWLEGLLLDRVPHADPLAASSLAGTVMAIFEAAEREWIRTAGGRVDDHSATEFNRLLHRGLRFAAAGWTGSEPAGPDPADRPDR